MGHELKSYNLAKCNHSCDHCSCHAADQPPCFSWGCAWGDIVTVSLLIGPAGWLYEFWRCASSAPGSFSAPRIICLLTTLPNLCEVNLTQISVIKNWQQSIVQKQTYSPLLFFHRNDFTGYICEKCQFWVFWDLQLHSPKQSGLWSVYATTRCCPS